MLSEQMAQVRSPSSEIGALITAAPSKPKKKRLHGHEVMHPCKIHNANPLEISPKTLTLGSSLRCVGSNVRSMFAPANFYSLNRFLETDNPDIMFLSET